MPWTKLPTGWAWCLIPIIPAPRTLAQEDHGECEADLGYIIARSHADTLHSPQKSTQAIDNWAHPYKYKLSGGSLKVECHLVQSVHQYCNQTLQSQELWTSTELSCLRSSAGKMILQLSHSVSSGKSLLSIRSGRVPRSQGITSTHQVRGAL